MADTVFYNKRKLCYIDESDFTDFQGIGSDPLYLRYNNVFNIVKHYILPQYQGFLAQPDYKDGLINWYIEPWNEQPVTFDSLQGQDKAKYTCIKEATINHYRQECSKLPIEEMTILASALKYIDDRFIYCYDDKVSLVAWGMRPDTSKHAVDGRWVKGLEFTQKNLVTFDPGTNGSLIEPHRKVVSRPNGFKLTRNDVPAVKANEGFAFKGWVPEPIGYEVSSPIKFIAEFEEVELQPESASNPVANTEDANTSETPSPIIPTEPHIPSVAVCKFVTNEYGTLNGPSLVEKPVGSTLNQYDIPKVVPKKGYDFIGWNINPLNFQVNGDTTFVAQYEKLEPWYKRWWTIIPGWLKWLLLFLLLLLLFNWLFEGCHNFGCTSCVRHGDDYISPIDNVNGLDNNGRIDVINDAKGNLPDHGVVAPIVDEGGNIPPIIHNEGAPDVIANRLNIYLEDNDADIQQWAHDFKSAYPGDEYQIIGYDENVKMLQIKVPESQRDRLREELPSRLPNQNFFVVDESIMSLLGDFTQRDNGELNGWHLTATNARNGWNITKGSNDVVIAIVDDGIDPSHPIFGNRFYKAYNVFTQDNKLSKGEGHGTHVAGLAAGNDKFLSQGAAGIAQNVKIMPIQVFDNGICTLSSIASGIMYAIHNGADVVNISIGPTFEGLDQLPLEQQQEIATQFFKNEEKVFRHIIKTANDKNVILVFASGNDNVMAAVLPECRTMQTINVAAVDQDLKATSFTNYSIGTNISAPGKDIYSSFPNSNFKTADGTSMAAPIVAGTVALMRSLKPDLTVAEAIRVLQQTGKTTEGNNMYVPPMVQIDKALLAVKNGNIPDESIDQIQPPTQSPEPNNGNSERGHDRIGSLPQTDPANSTQPSKEKTYTIIDNETGEKVTINSGSDDYNSISSMLKRFVP